MISAFMTVAVGVLPGPVETTFAITTAAAPL